MTDSHFMQRALELAKQAEVVGEVPVGAVVVLDDTIIGEGWNRSITSRDPTAHAEIVALRQATERVGNYRLINTTLYVTLEPCMMCAGAMVHARIKRLVFATCDPKSGAVVSTARLLDRSELNHQVTYEHGVMAEASGELLRQFFRQRRVSNKTA